MAAWRVGFASMILLAVGCGETPKPAPSNSSETVTTSTSRPADKPTAAEKVDTPESQPQPEPPFQLEDGFTPLAFADFEAFTAEEKSADTWEGTADGLKSSGKPPGYLYSKQSYQNFTLRLDYRFPRPASLKDDSQFKGNTGFLMYITGEHKVWPICLEVQGKYVEMGAIRENGGAEKVVAKDDEDARKKARKPVGQWNSLEIVSKDGALSVSINGTPISSCEPDFISAGPIGIQAEKHPFEVRRMRIRPEETK